MNENLVTSQNGLNLIAKWEGIVLHPYICPAGKKTIGIGHVILPGDNFGPTITKEQAFEILAKDTAKCEAAIYQNIKVPLTQNQFDALVSFGFNCGVGVYQPKNSGVARELNAGNYDAVPTKLLDWCKFKVDGVMKVNQGLYNRRKSEGELWSKPDESKKVEVISLSQEEIDSVYLGDHKVCEPLCSQDSEEDLMCKA